MLQNDVSGKCTWKLDFLQHNDKYVEEDEKTDFIPALTQGKNSGIQDDELLMLRSEQQITFAALENQRQRMELLKKRKRTY